MENIKLSDNTLELIGDVLENIFLENARVAYTGIQDENNLSAIVDPVRDRLKVEGLTEQSSYDYHDLYKFLKKVYFKPVDRLFG